MQLQLFTFCCLMLPIICIALVLHLGRATGAHVLIWTCCGIGWISAQRCVYYATDQCRKRLEACINAEGGHSIQYTCCDIACLTFQLPHITTGSFQSHWWQSTTASFQSLQHLKERNKPSVRWKSFAIHKLVWWHFQVGWASGLQFVFFWDNANNQNVWIILLKMTFWISQFQRLHLRSEVDKSVRFHVKFSQDLTCQKSLKSVNFWQSISTCICNYHAIYARMP